MNFAFLTRSLIGALLICFYSESSVWAQAIVQRQDVPSAASQYVNLTGGTTLRELIKSLLERNKELLAARAQLRQAEARLTAARPRPNPTIEIEHGTDVAFGNEGERDYNFTYSQPIELGGKRAKRLRIARLFIEMTRAQLVDTERQLVGQLRALFVEAMAAASRLDLLERMGGLNEQMVRIMEVRLHAGDASKLDSSLLLAESNRLSAERLQTEDQLAGLVLQIKTFAGFAPEEPLVLQRPPEPSTLNLTEEAALRLALENRPDLKSARLREEMAEAAIELVKAQVVPNINLFVRYSQGADVIEGLLKPAERIVDRRKTLSFGVSIPLPLSNRSQGEIAEVIAQAEQARAQREGLEQIVRRDIVLAFRHYQTARRKLDVLVRGVLGQNQESFRIVKLAYDLGEMRLLDVLNQQRIYVDVQINYATAQKDYYAAIVEMERSLGKEIVNPN